MEKRIAKLQAGIWTVLALVLAVTLAVKGIQALNGKGVFPYWHVPTVALCLTMAWESLTTVMKCRLIINWRNTRRKAAKTYLCIIRAVRCLPALFMESYRKFQTEP